VVRPVCPHRLWELATPSLPSIRPLSSLFLRKLDLAFKLFCAAAEEGGAYHLSNLPPHPLLVPLHRWVLRERLWEHAGADTVMGWLLRKEWGDHGINLKAPFQEMLQHIMAAPKHKGLDDLHSAADDIPGAQTEIEQVVFAPAFIGNRSDYETRAIVRAIRERKYRQEVGGKDLPPHELLAAAQGADRMMPDPDGLCCVTDAVRTLLAGFPHCTYLTLHGSSSAYDPLKARAILDALADLRNSKEQMRVMHEINGWGVFQGRGSHAQEESEQLRKGLLEPLWWRYSSEMRVEYLKYCHRGRPEPAPHWTGQEMLLHDLMGFRYDIDEDFRAEFNRSLDTYRTPDTRGKYDGKYEPRLLQELWRDRGLTYEISEECPPELVRRIVTRRIDWDKAESGAKRWDESREHAAKLFDADSQLRKYVSAEQSDYAIDDLLGSYEPQRRKVCLYARMIRLAARELGIDEDALSTVVYVHETVHAFCHLGRDLNGRMWDACPTAIPDCPEEQISTPQEAIAQYYSFKLLDQLRDERLTKAFLTLEKACSPAYRAWRQTEQYSLEQMRAVLLQYRAASGDWPPVS